MDPVQALRQIGFELERGGASTYRVLVAGAPGRPGKIAALAQAPPVPCQNSRTVSELVLSAIVRLLCGTR